MHINKTQYYILYYLSTLFIIIIIIYQSKQQLLVQQRRLKPCQVLKVVCKGKKKKVDSAKIIKNAKLTLLKQCEGTGTLLFTYHTGQAILKG